MRLLRLLTATLLCALAGGALAASPANAEPCPGADLRPTADNLGAVAAATLCLVNEQRSAHDLGPVSENARLTEASVAYSADMVRRRFFGHVDPDGTTLGQRLSKVGYQTGASTWIAGENIATAESSLTTPAATVAAWMESPGHRANILEAGFREIGIGIALGSPMEDAAADAATYTTDFGTVVMPTGSAGPSTAAATQASTTAAARRPATKRRAKRRACTRTKAQRRKHRKSSRACARRSARR
jgi:uncharacterized protein YkwD